MKQSLETNKLKHNNINVNRYLVTADITNAYTKSDLAVRILTKKEIITPSRALDNHHGTINDKYSIVSPPPTYLYQCISSKRVNAVHLAVENPQANRSKLGDRCAGCCSCGLKLQ